MIVVSELSRHYGNLKAVDKVSFEVPQGQIVGLLGHNGAGKTTTMKMLTGFLEPSSGWATIDGLNVVDHRQEVQQKIGYLPENSPTYPEMTVKEYLMFAGSLRGLAGSELLDRVNQSIERTSLEAKAFEKIQTLSKGLRQRVGVAQAILHQPKILILDEPTSGLDPAQILEMRGLIKDLALQATVMLSTHILQEVEAVCDRAIIMINGRIGADASLKELKQSNALLIDIKKNPEDLTAELNNIEGVEKVDPMIFNPELSSYRIKLKGNAQTVAPKVAKALVEKGMDICRLEEERIDLEAVFRNLSENKGGVHV